MALAARDTGQVFDLDTARERRFFKQLGEHAFIAIILDEDTGKVHLYSKGVEIDTGILEKMHESLNEVEAEMNNKEQDGSEE